MPLNLVHREQRNPGQPSCTVRPVSQGEEGFRVFLGNQKAG